MKALIQRVLQAKVTVEEEVIASIDFGILIFLGITHTDTEEKAQQLAEKCLSLRIFEDEQGRPHSSLIEVKAAVLIVSQFTLYGDCQQGRRPSFTQAAKPELAKNLYEKFVLAMKKSAMKVEKGEFGAKMQVTLVNDGPFTLLIEK